MFRESSKNHFDQWLLTLKYCKVEFILSAVWFCLCWMAYFFAITCNFMFVTNIYQLPMNFFLILFPFDNIFSLNWFLSYLYQIVATFYAALFFNIYVPMVLIFMNHSCWRIDASIMMLKDLNQKIGCKTLQKTFLRKRIIAKQLKAIVEMTCKVQQWQHKVQSLMEINFFMEFTVLSSMFCLCVYKLTANFFGSIFILSTICCILSQLFIYCWMGSRVITRIKDLSTAVYETNWHLLDKCQRRDLQIILMMTQNMKGFNGIFQSVSLDTFQKVMNTFV